MPDASLDDIVEFLATKRLAVVGVSRDPKHFSRGLFREFLAQGYDAVPVNPHAEQIEGRQCFARLADITPPVDAALLMTPPNLAEQAMRECTEADIRRIWVYTAAGDGTMHDGGVEICRKRGMAVIEGYCPHMFLPKAALVHRLHRFLVKVTGSYPL